jgi:hypothetical protein
VTALAQTILSLRITHPSRDLSQVCSAIGLRPKIIWKKGGERRTPKGTKLGGLRDGSYCSISLGKWSRVSLEKQIDVALKRLRQHKAVLQRFSASGGRISFFVGLSSHRTNFGEVLNAPILAEMAKLKIGVELDIYFDNQ